MNFKKVLVCFLNLAILPMSASADEMPGREMGLDDVRELIQQNRSVVIESFNRQIAIDNLNQQKSERLPDFLVDGQGYLSQKRPLYDGAESSNKLRYHLDLTSEFDLYTGGKHSSAIKVMEKEQEISEERLKAVEQEVSLQVYVLMYDIYRNMKYRDFVQSSIRLREKEYERIDQFFKNGLVLKSDLLRSKLYITNLQKDEVAIENSIDILSDQLCAMLGMQEHVAITPILDNNLDHKVHESFDELFQYALIHSPRLKMQRVNREREEAVLRGIQSDLRPKVKLYAKYGVGSPQPYFDYDHQIGGEIGAKLSFSISSFYQTKHKQRAQKRRIETQGITLTEEEEKLKNTLFELYTRYHESLLNIDRALEKIDMSKESMRILRNSYFNQQALLIDVLESETQSMEASFEWVEAVVDSQKYYWALKQICGYL